MTVLTTEALYKYLFTVQTVIIIYSNFCIALWIR